MITFTCFSCSSWSLVWSRSSLFIVMIRSNSSSSFSFSSALLSFLLSQRDLWYLAASSAYSIAVRNELIHCNRVLESQNQVNFKHLFIHWNGKCDICNVIQYSTLKGCVAMLAMLRPKCSAVGSKELWNITMAKIIEYYHTNDYTYIYSSFK